MKKIGLVGCLMAMTFSSYAVTPVGQQSINELLNGGPVTVRNAAKRMYNRGERDTKVLDVLAEVVLRDYQKNDRQNLDATAWGCKALGASGQTRYRNVLKEASDNGAHRNMRKHCKKALGSLGSQESAQYTKGSLSLLSMKKNAPKAVIVKSKPKAGKQPLTSVQTGMVMSEVYDLIGNPTNTTSHQTGKAFRPFNFKGGDLMRMTAFYKGQGQVVFTHRSRYDHTWRVLEVRPNPSETGYP